MIEITDLQVGEIANGQFQCECYASLTEEIKLAPKLINPHGMSAIELLHEIGAERALKHCEEFARYGPVTWLRGPQNLADT